MRTPLPIRLLCLCLCAGGVLEAAEPPAVENTALPATPAATATETSASEPDSFWEDMATRDYLFGDAWGARPALEDMGIDLKRFLRP